MADAAPWSRAWSRTVTFCEAYPPGASMRQVVAAGSMAVWAQRLDGGHR
jgi:hypothetical protein